MSALVTPNQSFLVKQMQSRIAAAFACILWDFGCNAHAVKGAWDGDPNAAIWTPTGWRISDQTFHYRTNWDKNKGKCSVTFKNARFDPEKGSIWYGDKKVADNVQVADDAKTKIIKNDTDKEIHVSYEEEVSMTNAFSASVTKGVTLDMTKEAHADVTAEQKVSGEYMGVSAEASLTESFGVSASESKSESKEEAKEKSEEGTHSESLAIEFDAAPRTHYLVTISKEHETSYQPFKINGIMDFDVEFDMPQYSGDSQQHAKYHPHTSTVKVQGMDGFQQFIEGYDTNYPNVRDFIKKAYTTTKAAYKWLCDSSHRAIEVEGTKQESLESNASYDVEKLGGAIPDALAHLPVVNAEDVGE